MNQQSIDRRDKLLLTLKEYGLKKSKEVQDE